MTTVGETLPGRLSLRDLLKSVGRNSGALTLTGAASKLATFVVLILANRALPREEFGGYALVLATAEIIRVVAAFGVDQVSLRAFAREPALQAHTLSNTLILKAMSSATAAILFAGAAWYLRFTPEMWVGFALLAADFFLGSVTLSLVTFHQANVRADRAVPGMLAGAVASVAFGAGAFALHAPMPAFLASVPVGNGIAVAGLWLLTRRWVSPSTRLASRVSLRRLARSAWPLAVAGVMILLYFRISTLMLAKLSGLSAVASYTPAYKLSEAFLLVPAALTGTTLPLLASTLRNGPSRAGAAAYRSAMSIAVAISVPFGIGCSVLGQFVLVHVFGPSYAGSAFALGVLGWATVLMALNQQSGNALLALDRERLIMWVTVVNLAVNITANLILIPRLSFNGAALATLITEAVNFVMLGLLVVYFLRRTHE
ncbi:MAG: flippase [Chloroflexi bacterium]|nr:MAG: flippase [Chloroflexota bacterium]